MDLAGAPPSFRKTAKKRILVDARYWGRSGIGRYLEGLLPRVVPGLAPADVTVLTTSGAVSLVRDRVPECAVDALDAPGYSVSEQVAWSRYLAGRPADLIWSPHYVIPLLARSRIAVTIHDFCHLAIPAFVGGVRARAYAWGMARLAVARSCVVITVSEATKSEGIRLVGSRFARAIVIPNGADPFWQTVRRPAEQPFFLLVGNIKPHKNLSLALSAFVGTSNQLPHRLIVVGEAEGLLRADGRALAALEESRGDRVEFIGRVDDEALRDLYARADALICPSLYEGFGLTPLEAMTAGCPVLASDIPPHREVCGPAARYFDPRRPETLSALLRELAADPALRSRLSKAGRERAVSFSWDEAARTTVSALGTCFEH